MALEHEFTGRECTLREMLGCWESTQIYGIYGTRSIGKSRLASEFLIEVGEKLGQFPKKLVVDMRDCLEIRAAIIPLLPDFDERFKEYSAFQMATHFVSSLSDTDIFVVIFDNAEDLIDNNLEVDFLDIISILAQSRNIKIIITSTTEIQLSHLSSSHEFRLHGLSEDEGLDLMTSAAPSIDFGHCAVDLVRKCDGLPLAFLMVASVLEQNTILSPEELVNLLDECRIDTLSSEVYPSTNRIASVYLTFIRRLKRRLQKALSVLSYIPGSFNLKHIAGMLEMESEELTLNEVILPMRKRHMITSVTLSETGGESGTSQRFDIHGIIRDCLEQFVNDRQDLPDVRKKFCLLFGKQLIDLHKRLSGNQFMGLIADLYLERPNFQKLFNDVEYATAETYQLFLNIARMDMDNTLHIFLGSKGMHDRFFGKCLELTTQYERGDDRACIHISYGSAMTNIMGNLIKGEQEYRKAMHIFNKNKTRDIHYVEVLQRLGWNLGEQDKFEEGLRKLKQAFELENELGMHYEKLILQTLSSIAVLNANLGDLEEALKFHLEALKRKMVTYGTENHAHIGSTMNNIGLVYDKMGDIEEAFNYFKRGLEIKVASNAPEKAVIISRKNVADCLARMGRQEEALQEINVALETLEKVPDLYNEVRAKVYDVCSLVYREKEDYGSAVRMLEKALCIRSDLPPHNIFNIKSLCACARLCLQLGNYDKASKYVEKVLCVRRKFRKAHPCDSVIIECIITAMELEGSKGGDLQNILKFYEIGMEELDLLQTTTGENNSDFIEKIRIKIDNMYTKMKCRVSKIQI